MELLKTIIKNKDFQITLALTLFAVVSLLGFLIIG